MRPSHEHPNDRPQSVPNHHRPPYDHHSNRPEPSLTVRRVTVPEAAEILGTTTDAVRSRMRRGKLRREEGEDGTVYVILEGSFATRSADGRETVGGSRETGDPTCADGQETVEDSPLVKVLRDQVEHLRSEIALERESSSELRRIIAAMTQRVPVVEIEASPDERGGPESASEGVAKGSASPEPQEPAKRRSSWWRQFFGFE